METPIGELGWQAAIFVYKADETRDEAWSEVKKIPDIRGECHNNKDEMLDSLEAWNRSIEPDNAFLCIYAHMGQDCIGTVSDIDENDITWEELAEALPHKVHCLWLVGCESHYCIQKWKDYSNPVRKYLVATSESLYFLPLLPIFQSEISLDPMTYFDEMPQKIKDKLIEAGREDIAKCTDYYEVITRFKKAFDQ